MAEIIKIKASADDLELSCVVTEPAGKPRGVVQIVHGMCEHKERYISFMEYLSDNGFAVICHDHRGHGDSVKSAMDLGYFYPGGWKAMVDDVKVVGDVARERWPGVPFTLFGHSMGSMVVRSYAKRFDDTIDCLFVCGSPSDNPAKGAGKLMADLMGYFKGDHYRSQLLQKMSFGAYNKGFENDGYHSAWVCSDKKVLEAYHSDPLCQYVFTANGFSNLLGLMQDCYSLKDWECSNPGLPVHFISGAEDPCRTSDKDIQKAVDKMKKAGYKSVDLKLYEGMRHEILNETDHPVVWSDVLAALPSIG